MEVKQKVTLMMILRFLIAMFVFLAAAPGYATEISAPPAAAQAPALDVQKLKPFFPTVSGWTAGEDTVNLGFIQRSYTKGNHEVLVVFITGDLARVIYEPNKPILEQKLMPPFSTEEKSGIGIYKDYVATYSNKNELHSFTGSTEELSVTVAGKDMNKKTALEFFDAIDMPKLIEAVKQ